MASPRRFILITSPRSVSNLLVRILNLEHQPDAQHCGPHGGYFFLYSVLMRRKHQLACKNIDGWKDQERSELKECYQEGVDQLVEYLEAAQTNDKIAFVKEHGYFMGDPATQWPVMFPGATIKEPRWEMQIPPKYAEKPTYSDLNKTVVPDEILRLFRPIFLIRHPAMMFPSLLRTMVDLGDEFGPAEEGRLTFDPQTIYAVYEWYVRDIEQQAKLAASSSSSSSSFSSPSSSPDNDNAWPVIIDADDVINNPAVVHRLCEITGLDKTKLRHEWDQATPEEDGKLTFPQRRMLSTLRTSNGIVKEKSAESLDLDSEVKKWKVEFGQERGEELEKAVRDAIPHYEYMRARRLLA